MKLLKYFLMTQVIFFLSMPAMGLAAQGHGHGKKHERGMASQKKKSHGGVKAKKSESKKQSSITNAKKKRDMASVKKNKKTKKSRNHKRH